jgi:hypothetical protein
VGAGEDLAEEEAGAGLSAVEAALAEVAAPEVGLAA